jgi:outer membrane protein
MFSLKNKIIAPILLFSLIQFGASTSLLAQTIGLIDLYAVAQTYDAIYLSSLNNMEATKYRASQVDALWWPKVTFSMGYTRDRIKYSGLNRASVLRDSYNSESRSLNIRSPLFDSSISTSIKKAYKEVEISKADMEIARQQLIVKVAQVYFDYLLANERLTYAKSNKKAINASLDQAKLRFKAGTGIVNDVKEAQARYDLAVAEVISAEGLLVVQRVKLEKLAGLKGLELKPLKQTDIAFEDESRLVDEWVQTAASHPRIQRARTVYEVTLSDTKLARSSYYPTVDIVGSFGVERFSDQSVIDSADTTSRTIGVEATWELFSGFSTRNRVKEQVSLEKKALFDLDEEVRSVEESVQTAYFDFQATVAKVNALKAAEISSVRAYEATKAGYKVGIRLNIDVLDAQAQLFETRLNLAESRYNLLLGVLRLYEAVGQLTRQKLSLVSAFLE